MTGKQDRIGAVGSASMFLEALRRRRLEVKVKLSQKSIGLLNAMLRPFASPVSLIGQGMGVMAPYAAKDDPGVKQVRNLIQWLEKKVFESDPKNPGQYKIPENGWTGALKQTYLDRLTEIVNHYKPACMTVVWCEAYTDLQAALDGKEPVDEDVEEPEPVAADAKKEAAA